MSRLRFSVVITCYAEGDLILEAVESVRQQTHPATDYEIIVVNDGSRDAATNRVCRDLERDGELQVVWRSQNGGPSCATNDGFARARGEMVVKLDADDRLPPDALARVAAVMDAQPEVGFVYGAYWRQDAPAAEMTLVEPGPLSLGDMLAARPRSLSSNWNLLGTTPVRRSVWEAVGGFDPEFGVADVHDVEFWVRVIASGCTHGYAAEPIYVWRKHLGRNSRQVNPTAWVRLVQKHFEIYRRYGLEHRAHELLLLGSKWRGQRDEARAHERALIRCLRQRPIHLSSVAVLLVPSSVLRLLVRRASARR